MRLGAWVIRQLRALQRHTGLAMAIFLPLAIAAAWVSLRSPKQYVATTQVTYYPQTASARSQVLPFSPPSDDVYWNLSHQLGLDSGRYRGYMLRALRSHSTVSLSGAQSDGTKRLTVTFQNRSADMAAVASTALAKSVAGSISDAWQKQQPSTPAPQPQPTQKIQADRVPTREEILLNDALHQDEELHAAFQQKATEWARMRRQLSGLSAEEREAMATQLNRQRAEQEKQIIALQKQISANQREEQRLRKLIAKQPPEAHAPVPASLPTPGVQQQQAFPWKIAMSADADVKQVRQSPLLWLLLPLAVALTLLIVLLVDRFDGTVKRETDLQAQLTGSMRYLGAVPRIRHETLYR
ncbi:hypothetical protein [Silvibacterium acidisoli]|uniref:hypothetical protein n=1 Tax=Acidobacteriaceae bacterium ZG23-2 TaxID=2883246 RepID=UPI00406D4B16